jgi:pyruvate/oxaloacetate carboxyltransferase
MAIINGVDIVDTVVLSFSGGPAAPAFEIVQIFAQKLGIDTGVDLPAVVSIENELKAIRGELAQFDQYKLVPPPFDITKPELPAEIDRLFEDAIAAAKDGKSDECLALCQKIEAFFNYPKPDEIVKIAQIPGGMYTNMMAQLKEAKLERHLNEVLSIVPEVRLDSGVPPLVTPTSQIVGVQAVNCIIDKYQGKPYYSNVSKNFMELVRGTYGHTPWPINPDFREKIAGVRDETPYDTSKYKKQSNPELQEFGGVRLALSEKEELLLELFPSVADKYLSYVRQTEWDAKLACMPPQEPPPYSDAFWEELPLAMES